MLAELRVLHGGPGKLPTRAYPLDIRLDLKPNSSGSAQSVVLCNMPQQA